jgi:hypothetical protein
MLNSTEIDDFDNLDVSNTFNSSYRDVTQIINILLEILKIYMKRI